MGLEAEMTTSHLLQKDVLYRTPWEPSRDLLRKASGLSQDHTKIGLGISQTKQNKTDTPKGTMLKPMGAA